MLEIRSQVLVYMPAGFPDPFKEQVRELGAEPIEADASEVVCQNARTTGTLGKGAIEEHGLCVKVNEGWVLITGCAHPGIADLAARARDETESSPFLVVGGFHLVQTPESGINDVLDRLDEPIGDLVAGVDRGFGAVDAHVHDKRQATAAAEHKKAPAADQHPEPRPALGRMWRVGVKFSGRSVGLKRILHDTHPATK